MHKHFERNRLQLISNRGLICNYLHNT